MLNASGATADGGLVSSSAVLFVLVGVLAVFLAHRGIRDWLASRHTAVREHLYGPEDLHEPITVTHQGAEDGSDNEGGAQGDPDDGFDYSIFATGPQRGQ